MQIASPFTVATMSETILDQDPVEVTKSGRIKWRPKRWLAEYDRIVAYSVLGRSNAWIAEQMNLTNVHVSTILNTPQGKKLYDDLKSKIKQKIEREIPDVIGAAAKKAAERVENVLNDDELAKKSPFAVAGLAMDVLKGVGHLRSNNGLMQAPVGNTTNISVVNVGERNQRSISEGLQMLAKVNELHALPQQSAEEIPVKIVEKEDVRISK